jgi:hypothetical protein
MALDVHEARSLQQKRQSLVYRAGPALHQVRLRRPSSTSALIFHIYLSIHLSIYLSIYAYIYRSIYLSIYLFIYLFNLFLFYRTNIGNRACFG